MLNKKISLYHEKVNIILPQILETFFLFDHFNDDWSACPLYNKLEELSLNHGRTKGEGDSANAGKTKGAGLKSTAELIYVYNIF